MRIALVGDFNDQQKSHLAVSKALSAVADGGVTGVWIPTDSVGNGTSLAAYDGVWCVAGMPYRRADGALAAIQYARTSRTPFLGTSAGFQYALIEYARNVLGFADADHQKTNPKAVMPLISPLGCALAGMKDRVRFTSGSLLRKAYGAAESVEHYHCSFGLNGRYRRLVEGGHLYVAAVDGQQEIRAVELDGHPFFVATLFQPEMGALPNPLVGAFAAACARHHRGAAKVAS
jgi:CTP synthase (UTP-ammonia lyase)